MSYLRSIVWGIIIGLAFSLTFAFGFFLRDFFELPQSVIALGRGDSDSYALLDEVQNILDQIYLREQPTYTQRQYGAIRGLLQTIGDKNTFFIEPVVAQSEAQVLAGTYGGIGVQVRRNATGEVVLFPFIDSPSAQRGIQDNDILIAINGRLVALSDSQDFIDQSLRGEVKSGNGVTLTLNRAGEEISLFVEFAVINIPSVVWYVLEEDETIGYIQIMRFTNRTPSELDEALAELESKRVRAIILDLRNNSGGLLQESITVAGRFAGDGVITYEQNKDTEKAYTADNTSSFVQSLPIAVLVNNRTASASEIVAGAIRDTNRGVLIGQKTYGKGTVQQIFDLSDGSSIHVTSAEWITPNRSTIEGIGLEPNLLIAPDAEGRDTELAEAIKHLQSLQNTE